MEKKEFYKKPLFWIILIIVSMIVAALDKGGSTNNTNTVSANTSNNINNITNNIINTTSNIITQTDNKNLSDSDFIKYCINKQLGEYVDKKTKEMTIANFEQNGQDYTITLNTTENFTAHLYRETELQETKEIFNRINKEDSSRIDNINKITLIFNGKFKDEYGNFSVKKAIEITFSKNTLKKINWNDVDIDNLPTVADYYWQDSSLNK